MKDQIKNVYNQQIYPIGSIIPLVYNPDTQKDLNINGTGIQLYNDIYYIVLNGNQFTITQTDIDSCPEFFNMIGKKVGDIYIPQNGYHRILRQDTKDLSSKYSIKGIGVLEFESFGDLIFHNNPEHNRLTTSTNPMYGNYKTQGYYNEDMFKQQITEQVYKNYNYNDDRNIVGLQNQYNGMNNLTNLDFLYNSSDYQGLTTEDALKSLQSIYILGGGKQNKYQKDNTQLWTSDALKYNIPVYDFKYYTRDVVAPKALQIPYNSQYFQALSYPDFQAYRLYNQSQMSNVQGLIKDLQFIDEKEIDEYFPNLTQQDIKAVSYVNNQMYKILDKIYKTYGIYIPFEKRTDYVKSKLQESQERQDVNIDYIKIQLTKNIIQYYINNLTKYNTIELQVQWLYDNMDDNQNINSKTKKGFYNIFTDINYFISENNNNFINYIYNQLFQDQFENLKNHQFSSEEEDKNNIIQMIQINKYTMLFWKIFFLTKFVQYKINTIFNNYLENYTDDCYNQIKNDNTKLFIHRTLYTTFVNPQENSINKITDFILMLFMICFYDGQFYFDGYNQNPEKTIQDTYYILSTYDQQNSKGLTQYDWNTTYRYVKEETDQDMIDYQMNIIQNYASIFNRLDLLDGSKIENLINNFINDYTYYQNKINEISSYLKDNETVLGDYQIYYDTLKSFIQKVYNDFQNDIYYFMNIDFDSDDLNIYYVYSSIIKGFYEYNVFNINSNYQQIYQNIKNDYDIVYNEITNNLTLNIDEITNNIINKIINNEIQLKMYYSYQITNTLNFNNGKQNILSDLEKSTLNNYMTFTQCCDSKWQKKLILFQKREQCYYQYLDFYNNIFPTYYNTLQQLTKQYFTENNITKDEYGNHYQISNYKKYNNTISFNNFTETDTFQQLNLINKTQLQQQLLQLRQNMIQSILEYLFQTLYNGIGLLNIDKYYNLVNDNNLDKNFIFYKIPYYISIFAVSQIFKDNYLTDFEKYDINYNYQFSQIGKQPRIYFQQKQLNTSIKNNLISLIKQYYIQYTSQQLTEDQNQALYNIINKYYSLLFDTGDTYNQQSFGPSLLKINNLLQLILQDVNQYCMKNYYNYIYPNPISKYEKTIDKLIQSDKEYTEDIQTILNYSEKTKLTSQYNIKGNKFGHIENLKYDNQGIVNSCLDYFYQTYFYSSGLEKNEITTTQLQQVQSISTQQEQDLRKLLNSASQQFQFYTNYFININSKLQTYNQMIDYQQQYDNIDQNYIQPLYNIQQYLQETINCNYETLLQYIQQKQDSKLAECFNNIIRNNTGYIQQLINNQQYQIDRTLNNDYIINFIQKLCDYINNYQYPEQLTTNQSIKPQLKNYTMKLFITLGILQLQYVYQEIYSEFIPSLNETDIQNQFSYFEDIYQTYNEIKNTMLQIYDYKTQEEQIQEQIKNGMIQISRVDFVYDLINNFKNIQNIKLYQYLQQQNLLNDIWLINFLQNNQTIINDIQIKSITNEDLQQYYPSFNIDTQYKKLQQYYQNLYDYINDSFMNNTEFYTYIMTDPLNQNIQSKYGYQDINQNDLIISQDEIQDLIYNGTLLNERDQIYLSLPGMGLKFYQFRYNTEDLPQNNCEKVQNSNTSSGYDAQQYKIVYDKDGYQDIQFNSNNGFYLKTSQNYDNIKNKTITVDGTKNPPNGTQSDYIYIELFEVNDKDLANLYNEVYQIYYYLITGYDYSPYKYSSYQQYKDQQDAHTLQKLTDTMFNNFINYTDKFYDQYGVNPLKYDTEKDEDLQKALEKANKSYYTPNMKQEKIYLSILDNHVSCIYLMIVGYYK